MLRFTIFVASICCLICKGWKMMILITFRNISSLMSWFPVSPDVLVNIRFTIFSFRLHLSITSTAETFCYSWPSSRPFLPLIFIGIYVNHFLVDWKVIGFNFNEVDLNFTFIWIKDVYILSLLSPWFHFFSELDQCRSRNWNMKFRRNREKWGCWNNGLWRVVKFQWKMAHSSICSM